MKKQTKVIWNVGLIAALLGLLFILEQVLPSSSMLFMVLKKGAIYALVAVSMNLLNGFTGLFSRASRSPTEERLSGDCDSGIRGNHPRGIPVG